MPYLTFSSPSLIDPLIEPPSPTKMADTKRRASISLTLTPESIVSSPLVISEISNQTELQETPLKISQNTASALPNQGHIDFVKSRKHSNNVTENWNVHQIQGNDTVGNKVIRNVGNIHLYKRSASKIDCPPITHDQNRWNPTSKSTPLQLRFIINVSTAPKSAISACFNFHPSTSGTVIPMTTITEFLRRISNKSINILPRRLSLPQNSNEKDNVEEFTLILAETVIEWLILKRIGTLGFGEIITDFKGRRGLKFTREI
ncbi:hypothetical protein BKA69DRAFT_1039732 [Paraphysoderma sedebokerense]|nr:hypothetical protein BKA69DRAFT_1039732 [Paraphysoderma sedebokerense]